MGQRGEQAQPPWVEGTVLVLLSDPAAKGASGGGVGRVGRRGEGVCLSQAVPGQCILKELSTGTRDPRISAQSWIHT